MGMVAGVFDEESAAQDAVRALLSRRFERSTISVLAVDRGVDQEVPGVATGSALGGSLAPTGVSVGPWPVVGVGPVLAVLEPAAVWPPDGTGYHALAGMGFPKEAAALQTEGLSRGGVWVGVLADGREGEAEAALREAGAQDLARAKPGIHQLLHRDHERLDSLITELETESAARRSADKLRALWMAVEQGLLAHIEVEEAHLLPAIAGSHPDEVAELLEDHQRIEERMRRVDPLVQQDVHQVLQLIREHALRENRTVYAWADRELGARASEVLERIRQAGIAPSGRSGPP